MDIPKDVWFHLRLEVVGAQAKLYVKDMDKPALVMSELKSGVQNYDNASRDGRGAWGFAWGFPWDAPGRVIAGILRRADRFEWAW